MTAIRHLKILVLLIAAAALIACGNDTPDDNSGFEFSENTNNTAQTNQNNQANQNGVENNGEELPQVTFRLQNQGSHSAYIQSGVEPSPGWLAVTFAGDDEPIYLRWDCGIPCQCPQEGEEYGICMDCGMPLPWAQELPSRDEVTMTWNGLQREISGDCFENVQLYDDQMEAEFCFGAHPGHDEIETYIEDVRCQTVDFQLGVDDEVVVVIDDDTLPPPRSAPEVGFILENQSTEPIYIQRGVLPMPSWLTVWDGDNLIRTQVSCEAPNECDSGEPPVACGMAIPWVDEISPGHQERIDWNGINYHIRDGEHCYEEIQLYDGDLNVEICYGYDFEEDSDYMSAQYVTDPICETVDFRLGEDEKAEVTVN